MNRPLYLSILLLITLFGCQSNPQQSQNTEEKPPNVLFILVDDMGYGDVSAFNTNSKIPTPAINTLVSEGMRFTDAHAPAAVCVPSRYGLITGRYPIRRTGIFNGSWIEEDRMTLGSMLQEQGYTTACVGKWHLGMGENEKDPAPDGKLSAGPVNRGFDYFYGIPASLDIPPYYYIENDQCVALPTDSIGDNNSPNVSPIQGAFWRGGKIAPGFEHEEVLPHLRDKSLEFLKNHQQQSDDPFFLYVALPAPHTPWLPLEEYQGKSDAGMYGDFVYQVDQTVGSILAYLEEAGIDEETLIFFSSDNGPVWFSEDVERYEHSAVGPLNGMKGDAYEGGHRMPFVARWKGHIAENTNSNQLICFTDMMATMADLLDIFIDQENTAEDSYSFLPVLLNEAPSAALRNDLLVESVYGLYAMREGDWVYINGPGSGGFSAGYPRPEGYPLEGEGQLYNLRDDLGQVKNLYSKNQAKADTLSQKLKRYLLLKNE
ncbi:arylsulfatase A [Catalinimonas alkaloidigena]|uniref:sulfatase family protein n=1 Tax=Catalinimonas alkaloidigena TaxID=1075417 RepID=UPI002406BF5D|nr:arylsulfatase [Catalinimonas alkaloidigena]MDF9798285.1 arylsulfatase A [Catalinimonas alkaloidigena]